MSTLHFDPFDESCIEMFKYPMGEWQVRCQPAFWQQVQRSESVACTMQVQSADDWARLLMLVSALKGEAGWKKINVAIPYLPYARADRRFVPGDCLGSETFLKSITFSVAQIRTLDVHSSASTMFGVVDKRPTRLIVKAIHDIALREKVRRVGIVFPDEGAKKRYNLLLQVGNNSHVIECPQYACLKDRDTTTGRVHGLGMVGPRPPDDCPVLVVDDICDGGATFVSLAALLPKPTKYLYVSHGIFSKGLEPLADYKRIYTTDSVDRTTWMSKLNGLEKVHEFNSSEVLWETEAAAK